MIQAQVTHSPKMYQRLSKKSKEIGFTMPSDLHIGALLKTLVASRRNGRFLELGTGMGLSLSWMVDGMDANSQLTSLDNDPELVEIVKPYFENDTRVHILCTDGAEWLENYSGEKFDLVFADAWPGKYSHLDHVLDIVKSGGFYVIDDMKEQPNWPEGHEEKALALMDCLERREDLTLTKLDWSTGILIAVKK